MRAFDLIIYFKNSLILVREELLYIICLLLYVSFYSISYNAFTF